MGSINRKTGFDPCWLLFFLPQQKQVLWEYKTVLHQLTSMEGADVSFVRCGAKYCLFQKVSSDFSTEVSDNQQILKSFTTHFSRKKTDDNHSEFKDIRQYFVWYHGGKFYSSNFDHLALSLSNQISCQAKLQTSAEQSEGNKFGFSSHRSEYSLSVK